MYIFLVLLEHALWVTHMAPAGDQALPGTVLATPGLQRILAC